MWSAFPNDFRTGGVFEPNTVIICLRSLQFFSQAVAISFDICFVSSNFNICSNYENAKYAFLLGQF